MGRPRKKAEFVEGPQAAKNFERAMKTVFQVPKAEVQKAEIKEKSAHRRKKS